MDFLGLYFLQLALIGKLINTWTIDCGRNQCAVLWLPNAARIRLDFILFYYSVVTSFC